MDWLSNATVIGIAQILWGLVVKYWPGLRSFPNVWIPWANAIIGFLIAVFTPSAAHAAADSLATGAAAAALSVPLAAGQGFWQSMVSALIYEKFVQPLVERVFKWKKAV